MNSLKFFAVALFILFAFGVGTVSAQSDRGAIRGTVSDQTGAVVPNAKVVLTGIDNGETRDVTTGDEGFYTFPEVKAGLYRISVEAAGFQRTTTEDVKVAVQVTHTVNVQLQVGVGTSEVTVQAQGETLQTDTPVRQTNVTERQVKELPLLVSAESGGRTPLAFIFLDSNVSASGEGNNSSTGTSNASRFKISGGQALGTEILIDGASTRRTQNGTFFSEVAPGPNAFQEFTVSTGSYSAEFGNSSGGIVNFTLKSGTNQFHGEAYDLVRNNVFNSNSVLNITNGQPRNRDNQNDFGFNIGGPIYIPNFGEGTPGGIFRGLNDRAFFFFNYEGYRFKQGENVIVTVPTARMRTGDFGELLTDPYYLQFFGPQGVRIYDPHQPSDTRQAIPGNRLDLYVSPVTGLPVIDPAGLAILQRFPLPNRPGVFRNYQASSTRPTNMNQYTLKTDFVLTTKQRLTFSYSRRNQDAQKGPFARFPDPFVTQGVFNQKFRSQFGRLQHDYTITSNLLNHFNLGYTFYDVANENTTNGFNTSSLGIPLNATQNSAFPRVDFPGYGDPVTSLDPRAYQNIGSSFFTDRLRDAALEASDFVTFVTGRQTLKVGASIRRSQFNVRQKIDPGGTFNFRNEQTSSGRLIPDPNNPNNLILADPNSGHPIASLITGATEFAFNTNNSIDPAFRQLTQSYFVQDDIKATRKLTLNVGLRYDLPGLRTEARDRFRTFDPTVANPQASGRLGAIVGAAGQGGLQARFKTLAKPDRTNIGPRVGAAYAVNNKTVVRAGAGLYYAPILYGFEGGNDVNTGTLGYNTGSGPITPNGRNSTQFLSTFQAIPQVNPGGQFIGSDVQYFGTNFKTGRTFQYTVDVQRELPYNFVASVGYIGHRADRLRSNFGRLNALPLNALKLGNEILTSPLSRITNPQNADDIAFAASARTYAQSVGISLPTSNNAIFTNFGGNVAQALKPFPQYNRINNILESEGTSRYNALQVKLERRFAQGIQFGANYTFSRLVTDASEDLFGGSPLSGILQNPFDRRSLRTISPNNSPHVFVVNYLVELPFGKGKKFLNRGGIVDKLIGGFQISGVHRYQSGTPLVVFTAGDNGFLDLAGYFGNLRLNLTGQPISVSSPTATSNGGQLVLNRAAFAPAPNFQTFTLDRPGFLLANGQVNPAYSSFYANPTGFFGTAPAVLTDVRSDPFFSEDMSILKKTRLTETVTFEVGAEFFNVFNRTRFGAPSTDFRDTNFGVKQIVTPFDAGNRVIQFRARLIF